MLVVPMHKKKKANMGFRYFVATFCMFLIFFTGVYVGFFPDVKKPDETVHEIANLISPERLNHLKKSKLLHRFIDTFTIFSRLSKATYISMIMFAYFVGNI